MLAHVKLMKDRDVGTVSKDISVLFLFLQMFILILRRKMIR